MTEISSLAEANQYLARLYKNARTKYELDNMRQLMAYLDNPQDKFKAVHVAGTSGKTSTAYYLSALLTAAGRKTGLTVSPHIDELNERIQINGQALPEAVFCRALTDFLRLIEDCPVKPSWFEAMIAFAYWYFPREKVDYAVVEVGLGGLKDGTNVISRPDKICVITDIGYDHVDVLGETLADIAAQKAGIVGRQNQVFMYRQADEVMAAMEQRAGQQRALIRLVNEAPDQSTRHDGLSKMPDYQRRNWLLAYDVYQYLIERDGLTPLTNQVLRQTRQTLIPGRMETRRTGNKTIVFDGAHNVQKITALINSFRHQYPDKKPAVLIALRGGKEHEKIAALLAPLTDNVITTTFEATQDVPVKSMDAAALAKAFLSAGVKDVKVLPDHDAALQALLEAPEDLALITGSFYLLSQIRNNKHLV
ncbi:MAG: Mur ligase family protein [Candidatus Binatota bacterium]|nr:Mur ligase family protein [Candidatus Binatota bacterium]